MAEFFAMGGYGSYVWSAYALCAVVLIVNARAARRAARAALDALARERLENDNDTAP